jgi:FkbM family methyltransferase
MMLNLPIGLGPKTNPSIREDLFNYFTIGKFVKNFSNFRFRESSFSVVVAAIKCKLFNSLTSKCLGLFLRGRDTISISPQVFGVHEEALTSFIKLASESGYSDFLLDIGANIGLTSCQSGRGFKEVHLYEPNPLCCHILAVNASIALDRLSFTIHPIGLGDCDGQVKLTVPKHNWGGAFINESANSYSKEILAKKDGFKAISQENYFDLEIDIKESSSEFKSLFKDLGSRNLIKGVIKIDVEGYESSVLKGLAKSFPEDSKAVVVFESWDKAFNITEILIAFGGRATAKQLYRHTPYNRAWPKLFKAMTLLLGLTFTTKLKPVDENNCCGDIVLFID